MTENDIRAEFAGRLLRRFEAMKMESAARVAIGRPWDFLQRRLVHVALAKLLVRVLAFHIRRTGLWRDRIGRGRGGYFRKRLAVLTQDLNVARIPVRVLEYHLDRRGIGWRGCREEC